jgi:hypothetical protein
MNRQMIWQIYEMVLKNVLPYVHRFLGDSLKNIFYLHSYLGTAEEYEGTEGNCVVCGDVPTMAVQANECEHIYCFYCYKTLQGEQK